MTQCHCQQVPSLTSSRLALPPFRRVPDGNPSRSAGFVGARGPLWLGAWARQLAARASPTSAHASTRAPVRLPPAATCSRSPAWSTHFPSGPRGHAQFAAAGLAETSQPPIFRSWSSVSPFNGRLISLLFFPRFYSQRVKAYLP